MITTLALSPGVDKIYFINNFKTDNLYRVKKIIKSAGGKGINVARVSSILGERVSCVGYKAGYTGSWIESEVCALGVNTSFIEVKGESRTNNNIIDKEKGTETEVLEIGPDINTENVIIFLNIFEEILKHTSVLVCSGGIPKGIDKSFYRKIINIAKQYDVKTILDASGDVLADAIKARPYMVKPNLRELSIYVNTEMKSINDVLIAAEGIVKEGVEVVLASMENEGALMVTNDYALWAQGPNIDVVNTIGSGDSMVAGMAVGIKRRMNIEDCLRLGMACGITNAMYDKIGYVENNIVNKYYKDIKIKTITPGSSNQIQQ